MAQAEVAWAEVAMVAEAAVEAVVRVAVSWEEGLSLELNFCFLFLAS